MNLLNKLAQVSTVTMLSRILGFIRDNVIARVFGASMEADAFFVAFKLPNLLRRIFAEGAFSQAFVPILAEYKERQSIEQTRIFVAFIAGLLTLSLAVITVIGIICAPYLVLISAPGFADNLAKFTITTDLLRVTFPYIFFISLSSCVGAILNTWNVFSVPAFAPALLNLSFIVCALFLAPLLDVPIMALAIAVIIGGILQLLYQLPFLAKISMLVLPRFSLRDSCVLKVLKNMSYAVIGVSVAQISLLINTVFASFLVAGSVSWMYYADRLMELPVGVLGVALGTLLLPSLAKTYAQNDVANYHKLLNWGLKLCLLLAIPCAAGLMLLARPITITLFMYGKFAQQDVIMTERALMAYAIGLIALLLIKVFAPGFYARQNIKTPVKIAVCSLFFTQILNIIFLSFTNLAHVGLALSISLAAWLNASLLLHQLKRNNLLKLDANMLLFGAKVLFSTVVMGCMLWQLTNLFNWYDGSMLVRLAKLLLVVFAGGCGYLASLWLLGVRMRDFILIRV